MEIPARVVTLVLVDSSGSIRGALPSYEVTTPWWMDMTPVVSEAASRFGLRVTVLRLLSSERPEPHGGAVTYLAEVEPKLAQTLPLDPWFGTLSHDANRVSYAHIGGPGSDLSWAAKILNSHGQEIVGRPAQQRTWNLSSIWRIPTQNEPAWLKVVPLFFAHEGLVISTIAKMHSADHSRSWATPVLLGHDGARILMAEIPGSARHEAPLAERTRMIDELVSLQRSLHHDAIDTLLKAGVPDWRAPALMRALTELIESSAGNVNSEDDGVLTEFARSLPDRFEEIEHCGLPDGLVHGDFHAGNVVGDGESLAIIDWGDSGIGHPLLDQPAFLSSSQSSDVAALQEHWSNAWRQAVPGCQPERAAALLAPVAAARQALIYQTFLDAIEATERRYHEADVLRWLHRAANLLRD
jgi:aminoglycoside phosphotransferase (APT) family kinase protein